MTEEIKIGDTVISGTQSNGQWKVIGAYDEYLWVIPESRVHGPMTTRRLHWEKVEKFFEAGKSYERIDDIRGGLAVFDCLCVAEHLGNRAAFGVLRTQDSSRGYFTTREKFNDIWEEIKDNKDGTHG